MTERVSLLTQLGKRRGEIVNEQFHRLPVPRWSDPEIVVVYKPVPHEKIRDAQTRVEKAAKARRSEVEIESNCDILIAGCTAVVAILDGQEYSLNDEDPNGPPTIFDRDLGRNLGLPETARAREIVRALFITDGDILSHVTSLVAFSGYRETEASDAFLGE